MRLSFKAQGPIFLLLSKREDGMIRCVVSPPFLHWRNSASARNGSLNGFFLFFPPLLRGSEPDAPFFSSFCRALGNTIQAPPIGRIREPTFFFSPLCLGGIGLRCKTAGTPSPFLLFLVTAITCNHFFFYSKKESPSFSFNNNILLAMKRMADLFFLSPLSFRV